MKKVFAICVMAVALFLVVWANARQYDPAGDDVGIAHSKKEQRVVCKVEYNPFDEYIQYVTWYKTYCDYNTVNDCMAPQPCGPAW